jgi:hypothetical protein
MTVIVYEIVNHFPVLNPRRLQLIKKVLEDVLHLLFRQVRVSDSKMDTRDHGDVDGFDTVRGENDYPFIVFQYSQQNRDECITSCTRGSSSRLEEHVGFVDEEDCFPFAGKIEKLLEVALCARCVESDFRNADYEEWLCGCFGDSLCGELRQITLAICQCHSLKIISHRFADSGGT